MFFRDLLCWSFARFMPKHPMLEQLNKPEAIYWDVPLQTFGSNEFEKHIIASIRKPILSFSSTPDGVLRILVNMLWMQDKASPVPQSTYNPFNRRISFLIAEVKWEVSMIGEHLGNRLLIGLLVSSQ